MCQPEMKVRPINIIGEHLLPVTTRGEPERPSIHQPHRRVAGGGRGVRVCVLHPPPAGPLTHHSPLDVEGGCESGPGTCLTRATFGRWEGKCSSTLEKCPGESNLAHTHSIAVTCSGASITLLPICLRQVSGHA